MMNKEIKKFIKTLKIDNRILGIYFTKKLPKDFKNYRDTACTALARAFLKNETLVFDARTYSQLCPGAFYFLKLEKIGNKETINTYVNREHVFKNKDICQKFLNDMPKFPLSMKGKFIIIKPFAENDKPSVVILLANPAQANRIISLTNYDRYSKIEMNPSQPTCLAFFAPLTTGKIHINFLDYYDRYYQGVVSGKNIWPDDKMIISMSFNDFKKILSNLEKSPHGLFRPYLSPQKVDKIENL
ncbi:MAG: hypothetical protein CEN87_406 [Parcubacteria group bacterium Licking1014_1]|nr:MAG: hypothetical protein CEN87_406 [Parcubacteria group bacterium Licking1014_1]